MERSPIDAAERQAVIRLKQGDIGGLEVLVAHHYVRAVRAAYLITGDRPQAEDIVQAAFLRAYERIGQFDAARPFAPWFLRSVVNDAVKAASRRRPHLSLDDADPDSGDALADPAPNLDERLAQTETRQAVWEALSALSPELRAAVVQRYYLGLTEREIAADLDCPQGTVKWRLHTARQRLRALLAPLHDGLGEKLKL